MKITKEIQNKERAIKELSILNKNLLDLNKKSLNLNNKIIIVLLLETLFYLKGIF